MTVADGRPITQVSNASVCRWSQLDSSRPITSYTSFKMNPVTNRSGSSLSICEGRTSDGIFSPMELEVQAPLFKLKCWRGLYEHGPFNPRAQEGIDDRLKLEKVLRRESSVYSHRRNFPCLRNNRFTSGTQYLQSHPLQRRPTTQPGLKHPPKHPQVSAQSANSHCSNDQVCQKATRRVTGTQQSEETPHNTLPRPDTGRLLFRRPVSGKTSPLYEKDDLFLSFAKTIDLKPLVFEKNNDSIVFYTKHYPLILEKLDKKDGSVSHKIGTPVPDAGGNHRRHVSVAKKLIYQEMALEELEEGTEEGKFITELRDIVFDPSKWPWNKPVAKKYGRNFSVFY
ncbi:hypothetical protein ScPMuIL_013457 [Solemya velum]